MADSVKLIECPRDAWQGLQEQIPADLKVDYLKALISAGFKHIDAVSFVSSKAVPQMADSEAVLKELDPPDDVEIIGIVVNEKGAQRAINTQAVSTLGFPYSVSPTFLRNNQRQTPEESLDELDAIQKKADDAGVDLVVYISMAFGNPYGDAAPCCPRSSHWILCYARPPRSACATQVPMRPIELVSLSSRRRQLRRSRGRLECRQFPLLQQHAPPLQLQLHCLCLETGF